MANLQRFYSLVDDETKQQIAENNRRTGQELFKPKPKIDKNSAMFTRDLKDIFTPNGVSFPLLDNSGKTLFELVYIGKNGLFLGNINKDFVSRLKNYNNLYSIQINDQISLRIINVIRSNIDVGVGIELMILQTADHIIFNSIQYPSFITPAHYMIAYNIGNDVLTTNKYDDIVNVQIGNISNNQILVDTELEINVGAPLLFNNMIIGICSKTTTFQKTFIKIASYNAWISQYTQNNLPKITQYTEDQLYHIIHQLSHKVMELESKINKH